MFAFIGFVLGAFLLASPCRRIYGLRRREGIHQPLLADGHSRQINKWLPSWFALSFTAFLFWLWFFVTGRQYKEVSSADSVSWLWPQANIYLWLTIGLGLILNLTLLIWVYFLDCKTTMKCSGISAMLVLIYMAYSLCHEGSIELQLIGWGAVGLAFAANIFRIMSMERLELSWFAAFVALAGTLPEILWMLNVVVFERGTVFDAKGHEVAFWDIFLKRNCHWKASWTLNSLLRLPEFMLLMRWVYQELPKLWQLLIWASAEIFLNKNSQNAARYMSLPWRTMCRNNSYKHL